MRARDAELDHLRAEVVEVAVQPRLGVDAHDEVLDALGGHRRGLHAQRVEVVRDRGLVAVLGQVADREVHTETGARDGLQRDRQSSAGRCRNRRRASSNWTSSSMSPRPPSISAERARKSRSATIRLEPQHRRRVAVGRVGGGQRVVQRLDRERHRVRVVALEQQEARDRAGVGRRRAPSGGRPGSRRRPAAAPAPGRRAGAPRRLSPPSGSATRSIRRTMSADSIAAPACRNACASSRSIVRPVTPQNWPQRSRTYA